MPTLRTGSQFTSISGQLFTLIEDVYFGTSSNEVIISKVNSDTGVPTEFAIKGRGTVISGQIQETDHNRGALSKIFTALVLAIRP